MGRASGYHRWRWRCSRGSGVWISQFTSVPQPRPVDELVEPNPDIPSRDLFYGVGGRALAPRTDVAYRFLEKDTSGFSDNFDVEDPSGRRWDAKFGGEAKPEVAASRLLWAIGFYQPPVYYVAEWNDRGRPRGRPAARGALPLRGPDWKGDGTGAGSRESLRRHARAERPDRDERPDQQLGPQDLEQQEVRAPRADAPDASTWSRISGSRSALGARIGFLGSQSNPRTSRGALHPPGRRRRRRVRIPADHPRIWGVENGIHVDDVLWTCRRLAQLSDEQWSDAFRAGGLQRRGGAAFIAQMKRKVAGRARARAARALLREPCCVREDPACLRVPVCGMPARGAERPDRRLHTTRFRRIDEQLPGLLLERPSACRSPRCSARRWRSGPGAAARRRASRR